MSRLASAYGETPNSTPQVIVRPFQGGVVRPPFSSHKEIHGKSARCHAYAMAVFKLGFQAWKYALSRFRSTRWPVSELELPRAGYVLRSNVPPSLAGTCGQTNETSALQACAAPKSSG